MNIPLYSASVLDWFPVLLHYWLVVGQLNPNDGAYLELTATMQPCFVSIGQRTSVRTDSLKQSQKCACRVHNKSVSMLAHFVPFLIWCLSVQ